MVEGIVRSISLAHTQHGYRRRVHGETLTVEGNSSKLALRFFADDVESRWQAGEIQANPSQKRLLVAPALAGLVTI